MQPSKKQSEYDGPVGKGTEEDENVPDGMIVRSVVVGEEVGSGGVCDAFGKKEPKRGWLQCPYHGFCKEDNAPSHNEIDGKRESRPSSKRKDFIEGSDQNDRPLQGKDQPAKPSAHYADEDGRVGTGNHHIDADMVALAQSILQPAFSHPMINRAAEEHKEHADEEANDTKRHLPAHVGRQPHQPDAAQGEERSAKMRPRVAKLCLNWPKPFRLHLVSVASVPRKKGVPYYSP